jgi:CBS domain containing-hemolysin-like protein
MTVNTLYFVVGSVLAMRLAGNVLAAAITGVLTVLVIVVFGEVIPKVLGSSLRVRAVMPLAPGLLAVHRAITPMRIVLSSAVIAPLARLTAPTTRPPKLEPDELDALVELSGKEGVIDDLEHELLREVVRMRDLRVSDVMMPRVELPWIGLNATRADVLRVAEQHRLSRVPVRAEDGDLVVGFLVARAYLLDTRGEEAPLQDHLVEARYVPELASVDQLLEQFRTTGTSTAAVLDEWGGTAGVVTLEDVVEEIVGDIARLGEQTIPPPERLEDGSWRVSGAMDLADWKRLFGSDLVATRIRTVGGLFLDHFGRMPREGDEVVLGNVHCIVESVKSQRVTSVLVRVGASGNDDPGAPTGEDR